MEGRLTVAEGVQEGLDIVADRVMLVVNHATMFGLRGVTGKRAHEAVITNITIDVYDMAGMSFDVLDVHCGNGKLPVSRLEHLDHTGKVS